MRSFHRLLHLYVRRHEESFQLRAADRADDSYGSFVGLFYRPGSYDSFKQEKRLKNMI